MVKFFFVLLICYIVIFELDVIFKMLFVEQNMDVIDFCVIDVFERDIEVNVLFEQQIVVIDFFDFVGIKNDFDKNMKGQNKFDKKMVFFLILL